MLQAGKLALPGADLHGAGGNADAVNSLHSLAELPSRSPTHAACHSFSNSLFVTPLMLSLAHPLKIA